MLFNSHIFIFVFLPIVVSVYYLSNKFFSFYAGKIWLILASLFFYAWWDYHYLVLIIFSIVFNYGMGKAFGQPWRANWQSLRPWILTVGVGINLALLGYFKYAGFIFENLCAVFRAECVIADIVLPLAISFFTFQQIAYLVDGYHGYTREYNFLNYVLFVTFFPQLIAGPIVHHGEIMPQFNNGFNRILSEVNFIPGLWLFSIGLAKKVIIADNLAPWVNQGYDYAITLTFFEAWFASLAYGFQLYYDFSGYSDMALGLGLMFNIQLPINFNSPYKALDIQDFWRRWHITLSSFLRDYIYIPLGGNRKSKLRTMLNIVVTFLLGGIWHGAGWTFILWGLLHGLALAWQRLWQMTGFCLPSKISWLVTFVFVQLTWVLFRASDMQAAIKVYRAMFGLSGIVLPQQLQAYLPQLEQFGVRYGPWTANIQANGKLVLPVLLVVLAITLWRPNSHELVGKLKYNIWAIIFIALLLTGSFFALNNQSAFLYFNF